ncbi:redoxin domain-containing protein [Pseudomonas sp. M30-35]|uniref:redoxin domain-containing protein n=1 Tax=Pseudomonas sp. M30-35 TaxID=1981174 RepID=UPI000B3CCC80|nr:redoxin domain-containing protein [Pseudomonas sp. M30-35]ARU86685.1 alkyl hydroperoxide reductase [Pseudomonas sp. M30-35]
MSQLIPRQAVPALSVALMPEGQWTLNADAPKNFTLLVFYRGMHCPLCRKSLQELNGLVERYAALGVDVIALSTDSRERAERTQASWTIENVRLGYGLSIEAARSWGLFVSAGKSGSQEPEIFAEPGVFLVRPDGTLYMSSVNTMPFARPHFDELLGAAEYVINNNYPARGEA